MFLKRNELKSRVYSGFFFGYNITVLEKLSFCCLFICIFAVYTNRKY